MVSDCVLLSEQGMQMWMHFETSAELLFFVQEKTSGMETGAMGVSLSTKWVSYG